MPMNQRLLTFITFYRCTAVYRGLCLCVLRAATNSWLIDCLFKRKLIANKIENWYIFPIVSEDSFQMAGWSKETILRCLFGLCEFVMILFPLFLTFYRPMDELISLENNQQINSQQEIMVSRSSDCFLLTEHHDANQSCSKDGNYENIQRVWMCYIVSYSILYWSHS